MKNIILFLVILITACSTIQNRDVEVHARIEIPPYLKDTITSDSIRVTYLRDTDTTATLCALHNRDTAYTNNHLYLKNANDLPYCSFYKLRWSDKDIIILTRGCNTPPNVESIVITFAEGGGKVNYYGFIRDYDYENNYIVYSEDYSTNYLIVEDVFTQAVIDTMRFEPFVQEDDIIDISLTTELTKNDGKYFTFSEDTVFFNFFGRDTFLLLEKNSGVPPRK